MQAVEACEYLAEPMAEPIKRANAAASVCERASGILAEAGEDRIEALVAYKRAREAASLAAQADQRKRLADNRAERYRLSVLSVRAMEAAEAEAARFAHLNIDPDGVWTEPGAEVVEVKRAEAEAERMCEADPSKRASQGRYMKGCRCEPCKEARRAKQALAREAKRA